MDLKFINRKSKAETMQHNPAAGMELSPANPQQPLPLDPAPMTNPEGGGNAPYSEATTPGLDTAHFDDVIGKAPETVAGQGAASTLLSKEDYHALICGCLKTGSILTGFKSLDIDPNDERNRKGTGAIYETISEIPALAFMLNPQSKWLDRTLSIALFVLPIAQGCAAERRAATSVAKTPQGSSDQVYQPARSSEGAPDETQRATLVGNFK